MYLEDKNRKGQSLLHKLSLKLLLHGLTPVLVCKDRSFSFPDYLRTSKQAKIPFSITGNLLFVAILNMYHLKDVIVQIKEIENSNEIPVPVFLDFSHHYLDENINTPETEYLFYRDLKAIRTLKSCHTGTVIFWEQGKAREPGLQKFFRHRLQEQSQVKIELTNEKINLINQIKGGSGYGITNANLLKLCREFIGQMETIQESTA